MTRNKQIQAQVKLARELLTTKYNGKIEGRNLVVTSSKAHSYARKERFGFHMEPENTVNVGDRVTLADGETIATVEFVL